MLLLRMVVTQVASQSPTVTWRNCLLTNNRIYIEIKKKPHILRAGIDILFTR